MGVVAYFWGVGLWPANALHAAFEVMENTPLGMWAINTGVPVWPGGSQHGGRLPGVRSRLAAQWLDGALGDPYAL